MSHAADVFANAAGDPCVLLCLNGVLLTLYVGKGEPEEENDAEAESEKLKNQLPVRAAII